jgi:hypothetical protein
LFSKHLPKCIFLIRAVGTCEVPFWP